MEYIPHEYQITALEFLKNHRYNCLFLDMGMGKSVITLTFLKILLEKKAIKKALIIAPLRVAQTTWPTELKKWGHLKNITYTTILGTKENKVINLNKDTQLYITNVDSLKLIINNMPEKDKFNYIVLDELSMYKNKNSVRFRSLIQLRPHVKGVTGLTGTPAPNSLLDLWAPIFLVDLGKRLGPYEKFKRSHFYYRFPSAKSSAAVKDSSFGKYILKKGHNALIYNKLKDVCLTMKAYNYIDMPKQINNYIDVELSEYEKNKYNEMANNAYTYIKNSKVSVKDQIALYNKLVQFANGRCYNSNKNTIFIHDAKLNALRDIVDTSFGNNILILSNFICDTEAILTNIPRAYQLDSTKTINDWNTGKIPVLVANPRSCGHGLNLQDGGNIIIWYSLTWSLEQYQQANARLYRQGQRKTVIINHLIARNTIDEIMVQTLNGKFTSQEALLHALKEKKFLIKKV